LEKKPKQKKIIIIGAGLAGMSAGCFLQMNGFETEIFEKHSSSGGLCVSWKRQGYTIDGCIHFMAGTSPSETTYPFWNSLIDMQSLRFIYSDTHSVAENERRERISFYSDVDRLEAELLAKAPEDKAHIEKFIRLVRKFLRMSPPVFKPVETMTLGEKLKVGYSMAPFLPAMLRYMRITNQEYAAGFKNKELKKMWELAFVGDAPLFYSVMPLVWRHKKEAGYPAGGAALISGLIEQKYKELGGVMHFNTHVTRILTADNVAHGIELENGAQHKADIIVSAADGRTTIYEMLQGAFKDQKVKDRYERKVFQTIDPTLYVALGINRDFSDQPPKLYFPLEKPIRIDPLSTVDFLEFSHYCEDASAAPAGKSLLTFMPEARDWKYWQELRKHDRKKYDDEKARIASEIVEALDRRFGHIKECVEMTDVVTPATYIRYTNNWTGCQISWKGTRNTFGKPVAWQINGLRNFYMTGQWASVAGGLNHVVMMGNHLAQIIFKNERQKFKIC